MKHQLGFLLLILSASVKAQVAVDEMKHPIPYVDVVVSGSLSTFWQTDFNGKIPEKALKTITANDTVIFHHISYKERRITGADFLGKDTVTLQSIAYDLKDMEVSSKTPKYQKMQACFRSLVIQDNRPLYYSDGKVDYLTKTKNVKYELFRKVYRAFEHKDLTNYKVSHNVQYSISPASTPSPIKKFLPFSMTEKYNLIFERIDSFTWYILSKDSVKIGEVIDRNDYMDYRISDIYQIKSHKLLNTEVDVTGCYIHLAFRKMRSDTMVVFKNYNQLLYCSYHYNYTIKHDKDDEIREIDEFSEIFVEDISFLEEEDQEYTNAAGMPRDSKYESEFWNECDCELYYPQNLKIFEDMKMR